MRKRKVQAHFFLAAALKENVLGRDAALLLLVCLGGGCHATLEDMCDRACECGGCSDAQRTQCVQQSNDVRIRAAQNGCLGELDDLVDCVTDDAKCEGGSLESARDICSEERAELEGCVCVDIAGAPSSLRFCAQ